MLNNTELVNLFNRVEKIVADWNVSAEPMIQWRTGLRKCLSEDVFNALESLASLAGLPNDEVHAGAQRLMLHVDKFAAAWLEFTDLSRAGADIDPAGSSTLWAAYTEIRRNLKPVEYRLPEPIEQLVRREMVPTWQVAKIYGWENVNWVQEELDKPGTHYDPKTWVHPSKAAEDKELADKWAERRPMDMPTVDLGGGSASPAAPAVAPESLETLIQQRVSVQQIAAMKQIPVSEVEQAAAMMGVVLAGSRFVRPQVPAEIVREQLADSKQREEEFEREQQAKMASEAKEAAREAGKARAAAAKRVKELRKAGKSEDEMRAVLLAEFPEIDASQLV